MFNVEHNLSCVYIYHIHLGIILYPVHSESRKFIELNETLHKAIYIKHRMSYSTPQSDVVRQCNETDVALLSQDQIAPMIYFAINPQ